jgi:DNA polymerase I
VRLNDYREVWLVAFEFERPPGERPTPFALAAEELHSGRRLRLGPGDCQRPEPPYPVGPDVLFVAYDAPAALGCHLALSWPLPGCVLDLHAEFRRLTSGLLPPGDYMLADALAQFRLNADDGVDGLKALLQTLLSQLDLPRALLRGRYTKAVAWMEWDGVPLDVGLLDRLRAGWDHFRDRLVKRVDSDYGVFDGLKFNPRRWAAWVNRNRIPWPRLAPGRLELSLDAFRDMAEAYPRVRPMKELRATLGLLGHSALPVGRDGRNRCPLRPFAAKTGRNAPSTTRFIFGAAVWVRGLIRPPEGMALAYLDYEQQEFGIAAALSQDEAMMAAYRSGDPYLAFAKQAGAVPADATKASHRGQRERFKHCALGVQYGMTAQGLAARLGVPAAQAQELLRLHRRTYPTYWRWSDAVERHALKHGQLQAAFGWAVHLGPDPNRRSLRNFPLQANGAEMLRLACCFATEAGVRVCAPVHDALLIEAPARDIDEAVACCQQGMGRASRQVLPGFPLRTEARVVRFPDRYMDERGRPMWDLVCGLLEGGGVARCA